MAKKSNSVKKSAILNDAAAVVVKRTKRAKNESIAAPIETAPVETTETTETAQPAEIVNLKQRLIVRPSFDAVLGSRRGNRMRNFNSLHVGNNYDNDAALAGMDYANFYNPRELGGKKHNPKNVQTFTVERAAAIQTILESRSDVGATKLFNAGADRRSVWVAFDADNQ